MLKSEFEEKLGFEVSDDIYHAFNTLYMNCKLNQTEFVKEYKSVIKKFRKEPKPPKKVLVGIYNKSGYDKTPNGAWYYAYDADYIGFDIAKGKPVVSNLIPHNGDFLCFSRPDFYKERCIIKEEKKKGGKTNGTSK